MSTLKTSQARERILKKIRKSLEEKLPRPYPDSEKIDHGELFVGQNLSAEEIFAHAFIDAGGHFVYCERERTFFETIEILQRQRGWQRIFCTIPDLLDIFHQNKMNGFQSVPEKFETGDAVITDCEALISRTGSAVFSSRQAAGRWVSAMCPVFIFVAYAGQILPDIHDGVAFMQRKYGASMPSEIYFSNGPTGTTEIEKRFAIGAYGPREVFCFFMEDEISFAGNTFYGGV